MGRKHLKNAQKSERWNIVRFVGPLVCLFPLGTERNKNTGFWCAPILAIRGFGIRLCADIAEDLCNISACEDGTFMKFYMSFGLPFGPDVCFWRAYFGINPSTTIFWANSKSRTTKSCSKVGATGTQMKKSSLG